ncbi:Mss4-like protein [Aspergillus pseudodeflectus]|uniref:Mss4-like protein n=1 Tax=Aspergillus pseudodeflectus TaxID=176178 RepID=A0ABR4KU23_9EURO
MPTKTLTARCHCGATHFTVTIPTSSLPLKTHLCHCTICRTVHGAPAAFHAHLPDGVVPEFVSPSGLDKTTGYKHSEAKAYRHFCSTCGCHIGDRAENSDRWCISVSVFDANANEGAWEIAEHVYTLSTKDGGLAALLPTIAGKELKVWNPEHGGEPGRINDALAPLGGAKDDHDTLLAQCHCGGVSFNISRPRKEFVESPDGEKWVMRSNPTKWLASLDACRDCRLVTGAHVIGWLFVPSDHISPPLPEDLLVGTSKRYNSSQDVYRTFCGRCGATIFYSESGRPGIVDVAVGILRHEDGVMLDDWALWRTGRLGWADDGLKYDEGFARSLAEGLQEWGRKTHGEVRDFQVGTTGVNAKME